MNSGNMPPTFDASFHDVQLAKKMSYHRLGKTDIFLSKLSLGGGAFGGSHTYGEYGDEEAVETVLTALKSGINYIDTAPHYGYGKSEAFLGKALKNIPRNVYYLSTKVCRYGTEFDFSKKAIFESVERSCKLLGVDYIDLIIVHDVEFAESLKIVINESIPAVKELKDAGKVKYIGISGYPISTLGYVVEHSSVQLDFILTYCRDTLIDNTFKTYSRLFKDRRIGVINAGCLAMGLLSGNGPPPWHPASDETKSLCRAAANYCKDRGVELGCLALYYCLNQPGFATCLVGMNNRSCLSMNLRVLWNGLTTTEEEVLAILNERFFADGKTHEWEGVEVEAYRHQKKNKSGKETFEQV